MTRGDMRTRILEQLLDDTTAPVFWEHTEIDDFIQEAQEIVAEEVRAWRKTVYLPKREGFQVYNILTVAPDCMAPYRIWDESTHRRLAVRSLQQLDQSSPRWLATHGSFPEVWFPVSWAQFGVYPATGAGGGLLRVDCLTWPTPLMDDDDTPVAPPPDHENFVLYGVYLGLIQQLEVQRATERFVRFTEGWGDSRARNEVQRLQERQWQRRSRNGHDR